MVKKKVSINGLINFRVDENKPLLIDSVPDNMPFLQDYFNNFQPYDSYIRMQYYNRVLVQSYDIDDFKIARAWSDWNRSILGWMTVYLYKYQSLYDTMSFEYDPIANYDRHHTLSSKRTPDLTTEHNTTTIYADDTTKVQSGERVVTDVNGEQVLTNKVAPFDSADFNNREQNTQGSFTNTSTSNAVQDSSTRVGRTDKVDIEEFHTGNEQYEEESRDVGNIGVTTTMQMIAEQRNIVDFSFYEQLFKEIIEATCSGILV